MCKECARCQTHCFPSLKAPSTPSIIANSLTFSYMMNWHVCSACMHEAVSQCVGDGTAVKISILVWKNFFKVWSKYLLSIKPIMLGLTRYQYTYSSPSICFPHYANSELVTCFSVQLSKIYMTLLPPLHAWVNHNTQAVENTGSWESFILTNNVQKVINDFYFSLLNALTAIVRPNSMNLYYHSQIPSNLSVKVTDSNTVGYGLGLILFK